MTVLKIILYFFSFLALTTVVLPMIKKDFWIFRIFDYPQIQKACFIFTLLLGWSFCFNTTLFWWDYSIIIVLLISFVPLVYLVYPFTPFGKKMIDKVKPKNDPTIRFLVANIFQYNRNYNKLLDLIALRNPDIILLLETDQVWMQNLSEIEKTYAYTIKIPKDNTYGLLLYSKLAIQKKEINYLIDSEIPSLILDVLFDGKTIRLYALHPTPPVPQENENSTDRDAEILMIGKMAKEYKNPCIVLGDLNDVAWSYTTKLFLKTSGLLDPRRGRGLYSTFNSKYLLLRWPLDHYFVSSHFRLVDMKVEKKIGSDHFPISIELMLSDIDDSDQLQIDSDEKELVNKKINAGKTGNSL